MLKQRPYLQYNTYTNIHVSLLSNMSRDQSEIIVVLVAQSRQIQSIHKAEELLFSLSCFQRKHGLRYY